MRVYTFPTPAALAYAVAHDIADRLRKNPELVLGLPTGRTPLELYRKLTRLAREGGVDFSRATTFNLDEFAGVGAEQQGSYRQYMERHLFRFINIDRRNIHVLNGAAPDPDDECERYEAAIEAAGGIHLQILGIGANGHIGFNEPGGHLIARTHRARLTPGTRDANAFLFGGELSRVPTEALSMGMATILHARTILMIATGAEKAECVARMANGPLTTSVPASFLQLHRDVQVMVDEAAARMLSGPVIGP